MAATSIIINERNKMKVLKQFQQGDVWIEQVDNLEGYRSTKDTSWNPKPIEVQFKPEYANKFTLAYGEATGHSHTLVAKNIVKDAPMVADTVPEPIIEVAFDEPVFRLMEQAVLQHQEHNPITLEPGIYRFGQIFEYDYESQENRYIAD